MKLVPAYIALGANLRDPEAQVRAGFEELAMLPKTRLAAVSALYRSAPVGYVEQPDFVNAVAKIETALGPRELLDQLLAIERRHGRVRDFPNAPRTLDLDVILYDENRHDEDGLHIPHPRMQERAFVLAPLAELAPDAVVPGLGRVSDLLAAVDAGSLVKLEPEDE